MKTARASIIFILINLLTSGTLVYAQDSQKAVRSIRDFLMGARGVNASRAVEKKSIDDMDVQLTYKVSGLELKQKIDFTEKKLKRYACNASTLSPSFLFCSYHEVNEESRGKFSTEHSLIYSERTGAIYINESISPAFWKPGEIKGDIDQLSNTFREKPRLMTMPLRGEFSEAVIAIWGNIALEPLDDAGRSLLSKGESPNQGLLVDFLNDLKMSSEKNFPIYRIGGRTGYVWIATSGRSGIGRLRFLAADPSELNLSNAGVGIGSATIPPSSGHPRSEVNGANAVRTDRSNESKQTTSKSAMMTHPIVASEGDHPKQQDFITEGLAGAQNNRYGSPEERLAYWITLTGNFSSLVSMSGNGLSACLLKKTTEECMDERKESYRFFAEKTNDCEVSVQEEFPINKTEVIKNWKDEVVNAQLLGFKLVLPLAGLSPGEFQRDNVRSNGNQIPEINVVWSYPTLEHVLYIKTTASNGGWIELPKLPDLIPRGDYLYAIADWERKLAEATKVRSPLQFSTHDDEGVVTVSAHRPTGFANVYLTYLPEGPDKIIWGTDNLQFVYGELNANSQSLSYYSMKPSQRVRRENSEDTLRELAQALQASVDKCRKN